MLDDQSSYCSVNSAIYKYVDVLHSYSDVLHSYSEVSFTKKLHYIKYLSKVDLLYELWLAADYLAFVTMPPTITLNKKIITEDILQMLKNKRDINLTQYYGKALYCDLSGDYFDSELYDLANGHKQTEEIINRLKLKELQKTILLFWKMH